MSALNGPLPLVTLTLTTDEIAMTSAGLILLRRDWGTRVMELTMMKGDIAPAQKMILHIEAFKQRLEESVTQEQGQTLLTELIREMRRKP